jgi:hypothetical protein
MPRSAIRLRLLLAAAAATIAVTVAILVSLANPQRGIDEIWFDRPFDASWDSGDGKEEK